MALSLSLRPALVPRSSHNFRRPRCTGSLSNPAVSRGLTARACPSSTTSSRRRMAVQMSAGAGTSVWSLEDEAVKSACKNVAVLFDFDGTLGDTETPAMEVAYWELAPYFAGMTPEDLTEERMRTFIRENAGKAFEFMVDVANDDRKAAGLTTVEEVKAAKGEDAAVLAAVDVARTKFSLPTFAAMRDGSGPAEEPDFLTMQKDETVEALSTLAHPCDGVPATLKSLRDLGVRFAIATTSGKPRVPVSVISAKLEEFFPPEKIHSGESDFDPPKFKPDPAVYLLAASSEGVAPEEAVAVEDSASGVGSASNAGIGMIVGYTGASHIEDEVADSHAQMLIEGTRADNGIGADIVVTDMNDLTALVGFFAAERAAGRSKPFTFPEALLASLGSKYYLKA